MDSSSIHGASCFRAPAASRINLTDKAFDALVYLVEHAGRLVTKDELLRALWPTTVVEENSLYVTISALRRNLKDESGGERLIATVAGRGYQFVAEVRPIAPASGPMPPAEGALAIAAQPVLRTRAGSWRRPAVIAAILVLAIAAVVVVSRRSDPARDVSGARPERWPCFRSSL